MFVGTAAVKDGSAIAMAVLPMPAASWSSTRPHREILFQVKGAPHVRRRAGRGQHRAADGATDR